MGTELLPTGTPDTISSLTASFSIDIAIIAAVFFFLFIFALKYEKRRIIAVIFALYIGLLAYLNFPYLEAVLVATSTPLQLLFSKIAVFAVFTIAAFFIIHRLIYAHFPDTRGRRWFEAAVLSASATALLFAFAYHVLPLQDVYTLERIERLFAVQSWFFWWLIAPLAGILIATRRPL